MAHQEYLSSGTLNLITQHGVTTLKPIIQILAGRMLPAKKCLQVTLYDGSGSNYGALQLQSTDVIIPVYTVIRLMEYQMMKRENPTGNQMDLVFVRQFTVLSLGTEINRKLQAHDAISVTYPQLPLVPSVASSSSSMAAASSVPSRINNQAPQQPTAATSTTSALAPANCHINNLSPYFKSWRLRVRVTAKSDVRTWEKPTGSGRLFTFDVIDETGEIRMTAFNGDCDRFQPLIEKGSVYFIARGDVKTGNPRYNSLNNDYEITLNERSSIELCIDGEEALSAIPAIRYRFVPLTMVTQLYAGSALDVLVIIRTVGTLEMTTTRKNKTDLARLNLTIADRSLVEVKFTLWGDRASGFSGLPGQILAIKGALINDFAGGKNLTSGNSTLIDLSPGSADAAALSTWYSTEGATAVFTCLSKETDAYAISKTTRVIGQLLVPSALAAPDQPKPYYIVTGLIFAFNHPRNHFYKACPKCNKKLVELTDETMIERAGGRTLNCGKCGPDYDGDSYRWRILLSLQLSDITASTWVTFFSDKAEQLLGQPVAALADLYFNNFDEYSLLMERLKFKPLRLRLTVREEVYDGEPRQKVVLQEFFWQLPVDRARRLMTSITAVSANLEGKVKPPGPALGAPGQAQGSAARRSFGNILNNSSLNIMKPGTSK